MEDLAQIINPLNLTKLYGTKAGVTPLELAYQTIINHRPICNPMELATRKKVWVQPKHLPQPQRPNPGYLLVALWGCGGNQGLYGTMGGRGGCCPVYASSLYCGLKRLFSPKRLAKDLCMTPNRQSLEPVHPLCLRQVGYTKTQFDRSCVFRQGQDMYGVDYSNPNNPPAECYVPDKMISVDDMMDTAVDLGENWKEKEVQVLMDKSDTDKDGFLSEDEFLVFMGKKYLDGLPRDAYVREPWERTRRSTQTQEALQKCSLHFGAQNCIGRNPVTSFLYDVDRQLEEIRKHEDCQLRYQLGSYYTVESGEVWCRNSTWYPRWVSGEGKIRCGCYPPPLNLIKDVQLYPGCAATRHRCKTPPDWSQYS